jgi:hypothetical protein
LAEGEGDQGGTLGSGRITMCGLGDQVVFHAAPGLIHFATDYFFGRGVDEAELADGEMIVLVAHGWAEGAALDGARGVEIAGAGGGIEDGAGLVVGEVLGMRLRDGAR